MAAGLIPAAFWDETPRSFVTIMEGTARAAQRTFDSNLSLAWYTAAFHGAAKVGKLKKLSHYMTDRGDHSPQTADQMLQTMMVLQEMGVPMDIRQVN